MSSHFRDEVRIHFASRQGHDQYAHDPHTGPVYHALGTEQSSPLLSSRTSFSSTTALDFSNDDAYDRDRRRWSGGSSDTLIGTLIGKRFSSLKDKLPSSLAKTGYKKLVDEEIRPASRRLAHRKKTLCCILLAAFLLGIGGRNLYGARKTTFKPLQCDASDSYCLSLHDDDSLQDALISIPTLSRPAHPWHAEEILPFDLHHNDTIAIGPLALAPSAANRRQLDTIPSQSLLFDKQECLEAWVANGTICEALNDIYRQRTDLTKVDLLYSWVNGSDWRHSAAKWMHGYRPTGRWQEYVEEDLFPSASASTAVSSQQLSSQSKRRSLPEPKRGFISKLTRRAGAAIQSRFRDHEELRFSMRSAAKHLHGLATIHIVAPDFSAPYHLQPGARQPSDPSGKVGPLRRFVSSLRRRRVPESNAPFSLNVDRLNEAFRGLPSQLRRVQQVGTDRFTTDEGQIREGQVPQWLSMVNGSSVLAGQEATTAVVTSSTPSPSEPPTPKVRLHHDWNAFTDNWLATDALTAEERKHRDDYRRAALPTFNSMAIEAMLGDQPGLQDTFIYSNDDFFLVDDVSTGDISSPLFGPMLRLDYNLLVEGKKSPKVTSGEWSSLWHTNYLLDQRFGARKRPYLQHVHKSFSRSLLLETRMSWAYEHARLALQRFRKGGNNIVTHFLTYYNIVERHREALLWSFFMLRLDEDGDGLVSPRQELDQALTQMGLTSPEAAAAFASTTEARNLTVTIGLAKRTTLKGDNANAALIRAGWPVPLNSRFGFTSQDGYPLGALSSQVIYRRDESKLDERRVRIPPRFDADDRGQSSYFGWPDFVDDASLHPNNEWYNRRFERPACELDLHRCLVKPFSGLQEGKVAWEQVFKQFAYVDVACGDCLIQHLVGESGERGFGAFLPPADRTFGGETDAKARFSKPVPHLPLTSAWNTTALQADPADEPESPCFSVTCVLANSGFGHGTSLRSFASQLIQRYAYTIAESPIQFKQLATRYDSAQVMQELELTMQKPTSLQRFHQQQKQKQAHSSSSHEAADAWLESQRNVNDERPVFVCINDDITDRWVDSVGREFTKWMAKMWATKQPWEL